MNAVPRCTREQWKIDNLLGTGSFGRVDRASLKQMVGEGENGFETSLCRKNLQALDEYPRKLSIDTTCTSTSSSRHSFVAPINSPDLRFALKTCKDQDDELQHATIVREAEILAELPAHQNIIRLYALSIEFETSSDGFMVLELLGKTLHQQLTRWRYISNHKQPSLANVTLRRNLIKEEQFKRISLVAIDVARALAHLHKHRIVYGDLKPENVGFQEDQVKLFDFGLARRLLDIDRSQGARRMTGQAGTLRYMAPEALTEFYDESIDVYSFGLLLLELCTLEKPRSDVKCIDALQQIISSNKDPSVKLVASKSLRKLMKVCWADDPGARPQMSTIVMELQRLWNSKEK